METNSDVKENSAINVLYNSAIVKHAIFMMVLVFVAYPIEYALEYAKFSKYHSVLTAANTLLLVYFCIDASTFTKESYSNYIEKHTFDESDSNDTNNSNDNKHLRTEETFHAQLVPIILVFQCLQIIPIFINFFCNFANKSITNHTQNNNDDNNTSDGALMKDVLFKYFSKFCDYLKIFLLIILLPFEMYVGIITVDFGTLASNDNYDFLDSSWNWGHLIPNFPLYAFGIYLIWNYKYNNNVNNVNDRILFFNKLFKMESIVSIVLSLTEIVGELGFRKKTFWVDIDKWYETTWHHITMAILFLICAILTLLVRWATISKVSNSYLKTVENLSYTIDNNGENNDENERDFNGNANRVNHELNNQIISYCNLHNFLVGSALVIYGYGLTMHHPSSSNREPIEGIHGLSGKFAFIGGIFKIMLTWPITAKKMRNNNKNNNKTHEGGDSYDIFNKLEEICIMLLSMMAMCHFFTFWAANPNMTYAWGLVFEYPSMAYMLLIFILILVVWSTHLILYQVWYRFNVEPKSYKYNSNNSMNRSTDDKIVECMITGGSQETQATQTGMSPIKMIKAMAHKNDKNAMNGHTRDVKDASECQELLANE